MENMKRDIQSLLETTLDLLSSKGFAYEGEPYSRFDSYETIVLMKEDCQRVTIEYSGSDIEVTLDSTWLNEDDYHKLDLIWYNPVTIARFFLELPKLLK